jgi:hypothetical protein
MKNRTIRHIKTLFLFAFILMVNAESQAINNRSRANNRARVTRNHRIARVHHVKHTPVHIQDTTFYYYDGIYYRLSPKGYIVVKKVPNGVKMEVLPKSVVKKVVNNKKRSNGKKGVASRNKIN